jgi:hypothetical protein
MAKRIPFNTGVPPEMLRAGTPGGPGPFAPTPFAPPGQGAVGPSFGPAPRLEAQASTPLAWLQAGALPGSAPQLPGQTPAGQPAGTGSPGPANPAAAVPGAMQPRGTTVSPTAGQPGMDRALAVMSGGASLRAVPELMDVPGPLLNAVALADDEAAYPGGRAADLMARAGLSPRLPGETPAARATRLALEADWRGLTTEPPEMRANRMGALRNQALRSAGLEVMDGGRPAYRGTDAAGRPTLTNRAPIPGAPANTKLPDPMSPTGQDQNDAAFAVMAGVGRGAIRQAITKPKPGSQGYKTTEIPGLGTIVADAATGDVIPSSSFNRPDRKTDEKALTQTEIQQVNALQQSARDLKALEDAFTAIKDADFGGPVAGRALALDPTNVNVSRIQNLVTAATPNLARGVFREVGVLTDQDVARYQKLLPNVTDTAAQRTQKLQDLRTRLAATLDEQLGTLQAAGRDVSGIRERILGKEAAPKATITPEQARAELERRRKAKGGR